MRRKATGASLVTLRGDRLPQLARIHHHHVQLVDGFLPKFGRIRIGWPSPNRMVESEWDGRVTMVEFENWLIESPWLSLDRVVESHWPNPNELAEFE